MISMKTKPCDSAIYPEGTNYARQCQKLIGESGNEVECRTWRYNQALGVI